MHKGNRTRLPQVRALILAVHAACGLSAWANPQNATVVNGQVSISQPAAGALQINASNGAIINWKQFSIGAGEVTRFVQPSANSAVLNRVVGPDMSQLLGQLKANGQVFLINPNGIAIGGGARIDTNSFIASTLDIKDSDFLAGKLRFFDSGGAGRIRNEGLITSGPGGRIALIAPDIENTGIINAPDGQILLAAGRKLEITSMELEGVTFEIQAPTDSVLNLGKLLAENGAVRAFAGTLRHSGEIQASRLALDADGSIVLAGSSSLTLTSDSITRADGASGGNIVLQSANGTARVSGEISALGSAGAGGDIRVLGQRVAIDSGAHLDASGSTGGGQILVGGDFQGKNADVQNAQRVYVDAAATLKADATGQGDGGRVIVWADQNTRYYGSLSAQGGPLGGNGGFAEVSGKQNLEFAGSANLGAANGTSGNLLLDPLDIIISLTSGILPTVVDEFADFVNNVVTVSPTALAAVMGNVTLQAERDIYVKDKLELTTVGAGVTMTAGGDTFDFGSIYNTAGISTMGGGVTLRALAISGAGSISTMGGGVDLVTSGTLNYSGAITSGGAFVALTSTNGSVNNANVDAGGGAIHVLGKTGVFNGSYTTTGAADFTATAGSISVSEVHAATASLTATSSINAYVDVTDRVNASSSASYAQVHSDGTGPLRLGTLSVNSGLYLYSTTGMEMASGGLLTASYVSLSLGGTASAGSLAAPLTIASPANTTVLPTLVLSGVTAPAHIAFVGSPTIGGLTLQGTVAGLGGTTITGAGNFTDLSLGAGAGVLNVSATSTAGLASGLDLNVSDGGINATNFALPGAPVDLSATGAVTLGTMAGSSLSISARGAVSIGSAATTGSSGIYVTTGQCSNSYVACTASSPITAGTLSTGGTGDISLTTYDNGAVNVTSMTAGGDISVAAGGVYYTDFHYPYPTEATTNGMGLGMVVAGGYVSVSNAGHGNVSIGGLSAGNGVNLQAGNTYVSVPFGPTERTTNSISVTNLEPAAAVGSFEISNNGTGAVSLSGAVDRSGSGSINLYAVDGPLTATGNLASRYAIGVQSGTGAVSLANVSSSQYDVSLNAGTTLSVGQVGSGTTGTYGNVSMTAGGNLAFGAITSSGYIASYGGVTLQSGTGSITTTGDNTAMDVTATGNVTMTASDSSNGSIGNAGFANPLNIQSGASAAVTLVAGKDIGAAGKAVTVDTTGTIDITSSNGQFHVAATDGTTGRSVSTIRLSASAAGIGSGNASSFSSADLGVNAASDGAVITIGDLLRSAGTLTEFAFAATGGSGLHFGDVNLATTAGADKLVLSSTGPLTQVTGNILAGNLTLNAGSGDVSVAGNITSSSSVVASNGRNNILTISGANITTGNLSAQSVNVTGTGGVNLGTVTSTGTQRGYPSSYDSAAGLYPLDELRVVAGGNLAVGTVSSATSAYLSANGNVSVGGGSGTVTAGTSYNGYYADTVALVATGGAISASNITAYNVGLQATAMTVGNITATHATTLSATDITTGSINEVTSGYSVDVNGTNLHTGQVDASYITLTGDTFATGNLNADTTLTINALHGYAPVGIALSSPNTVINADGDINITTSNNATLTSASVSLTSANGNVSANLAGTSNLTINTGFGFSVTSDTWLGDLSVTAQWDRATDNAQGSVGASVSSNPGSSSQSFGYSFYGPLLLDAHSSGAAGRSWNLTYHDVSLNPVIASATPSSNDAVDANFSHAAGGSFNVTFDTATVLRNTNANLGNADLMLATGGDIDLSNISTAGGVVTASSTSGAVNVVSVVTNGGALNVDASGNVNVNTIDTSGASEGGAVTLGSTTGNIARAAGAHLITTALTGSSTLSSGSVNLSAAAGSIGTAASKINVSLTSVLSLTAKDEIQVQADNSNLNAVGIATNASGTGAVSLTGSNNFSGLSVTRVDAGTNLALGALDPGGASFELTALDGGIKVTGNVANVINLGLDSRLGNVEILASGGVARSVVAGNILNLNAGQDIVIAAGSGAAESVSATAAQLQVNAGRDVLVRADGASALLSDAGGSYNQYLSARQDFLVTGGSGTNATASVVLGGASSQSVTAGRDLMIVGGSGAGSSAVLQTTNTSYQTVAAGRDLVVAGGAGSAAYAAILANSTYQQTLNSGRDLTVHGGVGTGAYASISQAYSSGGGYQYANLVNLSILGGDAASGQGTGAYAALTGGYQSFSSISGDVKVAGGTAADNAALLSAVSSQYVGTATGNGTAVTDSVSVIAGSGDRASAKLVAGASQNLYAAKDPSTSTATGDILLVAGSGADATAEIVAAGAQTIGAQTDYCYSYGCYYPTQNVLVQAGAGTGAFASVRATNSQSVYGGGNISVLGGSGTGAYAELVNTAGSQTIGNAGTSSNDATGNITVQAGTGGGAYASVKAPSAQAINAGGTISVLGNSGAGAFAEIVSTTASQQIGATGTSSNDATDSILVQAGSGGLARIQAQTSQSIMTGGDLSVIGGSGTGMTAAIQSMTSSQSIGNTSIFSNDASGSVLVQGGSGNGAAAWIKAGTSQTLDAGGNIALGGGATNAYAEIAAMNGQQTIGNVSSSNRDTTDNIGLAGGSGAGAYARLGATTSQQVRAAGNMTLLGGTGDNAGAIIEANTGQSLTLNGALGITGGSGSTMGGNETGIQNHTSGAQALSIGGNVTVTGGSTGSLTGIVNTGAGAQVLSLSSGALSVVAPASTPNADGYVGIESGAGGQTINVFNGAISVDNAGALAAYITSDGVQTIVAKSMSISLSSPLSGTIGPIATIGAGGNQSITLNGDGVTPGTATLSIVNMSSQPGSRAGVSSGGDLSILMDYDAAGLVKIGDVAGQGATFISAAAKLTMVAGQLLLQGGAGLGSDASLMSAQLDPLVGIMVLSTLYGPVELKGGASGGAYIDPPELYIASNGSVLMQAGANAASNVNINAALFDLAATAGDLSLINSTTSPATATITAGTFSYFGAGNVNLVGGTVAVTQSGNIDILGDCNNCGTNLIGPFNIRAFVPPILPLVPEPPPTDYSAEVTNDLLALTDLAGGLFEPLFDENGNLVLSRRRLNQCY